MCLLQHSWNLFAVCVLLVCRCLFGVWFSFPLSFFCRCCTPVSRPFCLLSWFRCRSTQVWNKTEKKKKITKYYCMHAEQSKNSSSQIVRRHSYFNFFYSEIRTQMVKPHTHSYIIHSILYFHLMLKFGRNVRLPQLNAELCRWIEDSHVNWYFGLCLRHSFSRHLNFEWISEFRFSWYHMWVEFLIMFNG